MSGRASLLTQRRASGSSTARVRHVAGGASANALRPHRHDPAGPPTERGCGRVTGGCRYHRLPVLLLQLPVSADQGDPGVDLPSKRHIRTIEMVLATLLEHSGRVRAELDVAAAVDAEEADLELAAMGDERRWGLQGDT